MQMIDLHTHILPNIDDGAGSVEEALEMTDELFLQKVSKAVCTPHFDPTEISLQDFVKKRTAALDLVKSSKISLIAASETILHEYLFHYMDLNQLYIANTRYLLIELRYGDKWDVKACELLKRLIAYYNLIPIIAHIERYHMVNMGVKYIDKLIDMGCIIQLNTSSLRNKNSRNLAFHYMKRGYINVIASDCHNLKQRPPDIAPAMEEIISKFGMEYGAKLMHNAECIVNGIDIR
jgi:protein-tyrosine phosphatase